nr:hypothetical protein [Tanacetum cinerariifolium]
MFHHRLLPTCLPILILSHGNSSYIADSNLEEDEQDPEEDPADYPADGGDNDDNESSDDDDDDDDDVDKDEEEEEDHLAPTNLIILFLDTLFRCDPIWGCYRYPWFYREVGMVF